MTVVIGLILLGILVFIHELGHFFASKMCGVNVESFSIGMGPILFHRSFFETDWRISLFPFGGYCGLKGEKDLSEKDESEEIQSDSLYGVKPYKRAFIGFAGPFANFLFAIFAYSIVSMVGYTYYSAGTKILLANEVYPELHSAAFDAGLCSGDKIISIAGKPVNDFSEIFSEVAVRPDETFVIEVERNSEILNFTVHSDLDKKTGSGKIGVISDRDSFERRESKKYAFFPAIKHGFLQTIDTISMTFKSFKILFRGIEIKSAVSGPARITTMLGGTAKTGFSENIHTGVSNIFDLMALISVSLFIMNLLPIPILDGYLVFTSIIQSFFRIRISPKLRIVVQYIGLGVIATLFFIAITGDVQYFWEFLNAKK